MLTVAEPELLLLQLLFRLLLYGVLAAIVAVLMLPVLLLILLRRRLPFLLLQLARCFNASVTAVTAMRFLMTLNHLLVHGYGVLNLEYGFIPCHFLGF